MESKRDLELLIDRSAKIDLRKKDEDEWTRLQGRLANADLPDKYLYGSSVIYGNTKPADWILRIDIRQGHDLEPGKTYTIPVPKFSILLIEGGDTYWTSGGRGSSGTVYIEKINFDDPAKPLLVGSITDLIADGMGTPGGDEIPPAEVKEITFRCPIYG